MNNILKTVLFGVVMLAAGFFGERALLKPLVPEYAVADATAILNAVPAAPVVANKINPADITLDLIKTAGPNDTFKLHLDGIEAVENIDQVHVYLTCLVPDPSGKDFEAHAHVDALEFGSTGFSGNKTLDVTSKFRSMLEYNPEYIKDFKVAFVVVPKNRGVRLDEASFSVKDTYFTIEKGNPIKKGEGPVLTP